MTAVVQDEYGSAPEEVLRVSETALPPFAKSTSGALSRMSFIIPAF